MAITTPYLKGMEFNRILAQSYIVKKNTKMHKKGIYQFSLIPMSQILSLGPGLKPMHDPSA